MLRNSYKFENCARNTYDCGEMGKSLYLNIDSTTVGTPTKKIFAPEVCVFRL